MEDYNDRKDRAFREYLRFYFRLFPQGLQLSIPFEELKDDIIDFAALEWDFKSGFDYAYAYIHAEATETDLENAALEYARELGEELDYDNYEGESIAILAFFDGAFYCMNNMKCKLRQLHPDSILSDTAPQEPSIIRPFVERVLTDIKKHNYNGLLAMDNSNNTNVSPIISISV